MCLLKHEILYDYVEDVIMGSNFDTIIEKYNNLYNDALNFREQQTLAIKQKALTISNKLRQSNISVTQALEELKDFNNKLDIELKYENNKMFHVIDIIEDLKLTLNDEEIYLVRQKEQELQAMIVEQSGIVIPELVELEKMLKKTKKNSVKIDFLKEGYSLSVIITHIILAIILILLAVGFDNYGAYVAMRVLIVLGNIVLLVFLISSIYSERVYVKEGMGKLLWINGIFYVFNIFFFAIAKLPREGWIILDIVFCVAYIVLMILTVVLRPFRKVTDKNE